MTKLMFLRGAIYNLLAPIFPETIRKIRILDSAKYYNMYTEENEAYYAKLYLHIIITKLRLLFGNKKLKILDVGCGQGRLSIPLAAMGHIVEGVDLSSNAIQLANKYATEKNISLSLKIKDIEEPFSNDMSEKYDCILCTEVIYMVKNYENILNEFYRLLKKNGLIFISFRSKYFYILHSLKNKRFDDARFVVYNQSGLKSQLNWHTREEILELLSKFKLKDIEFHGIGICSGIGGDPLSLIVEPKNLMPDEQKILFEIETKLSERYADVGRYILVSAIKS